VADVYDALTTARSYRPALSQAESLQIMTRDAGKIQGSRVFALFCTLITESVPQRPDHSTRQRVTLTSHP
jgi:HD-GYP domain-containing protein (c-di-GMP phosphodiesterase class II)